MKSFLKSLILAAYWAFLTQSLLMTQPWELFSKNLAVHPPIDLSFEPTSWIAHISAYALLGVLILWTSSKKPKWNLFLFLLAFAHSGACEYLQGMIPNRWPNLWDVFSNTLGLMFALVLHKIPKRHLKASQDLFLKTSPEKRAA